MHTQEVPYWCRLVYQVLGMRREGGCVPNHNVVPKCSVFVLPHRKGIVTFKLLNMRVQNKKIV